MKNKFLGISKIICQDVEMVMRVNTIIRKPKNLTGWEFRSEIRKIPGVMDIKITRLDKEEFQVIYYVSL